MTGPDQGLSSVHRLHGRLEKSAPQCQSSRHVGLAQAAQKATLDAYCVD